MVVPILYWFNEISLKSFILEIIQDKSPLLDPSAAICALCYQYNASDRLSVTRVVSLVLPAAVASASMVILPSGAEVLNV